MHERNIRRRAAPLLVSAAALLLTMGAVVSQTTHVAAQGQGAAANTPQALAPIDMVGQWVSVVTEDWRWRMVTPPKGDYSSVPLNAEGRRVADTWDPARDTADGNACKAYGAPGLLRIPGRLRISWQDPHTLKIETDAGQQTRLLHFDDPNPPAGNTDFQGYSSAVWEIAGQRGGGGNQGGGGAAPAPAEGQPQQPAGR